MSDSDEEGELDFSRPIGWWEDYDCGCVSETVRRRRDLLGYCERHGDSRRHAYRDYARKRKVDTGRDG